MYFCLYNVNVSVNKNEDDVYNEMYLNGVTICFHAAVFMFIYMYTNVDMWMFENVYGNNLDIT